jgi:hypothetical protein
MHMKKRAELFHLLLIVVLLGYILFKPSSMVVTTPTDISVRSTSQNEHPLDPEKKATSQDEFNEF